MINLNLTKEEFLFIEKIIDLTDRNKTASRPYNVLAQAGYTKTPEELEQVVKKMSDTLNTLIS